MRAISTKLRRQSVRSGLSRPAVPWARIGVMSGLAVGALLLAGCTGGPLLQGDGSAVMEAEGFAGADSPLTLLDVQDRRPSPELAGFTLYDQPIALSDYQGQVVVLNIWASWCGPCREEAPALRSVWNATNGKGVQFIGLVTRDSDAAAKAFATRFELGYPHLRDADGSLQLILRDSVPAQAIPSTLFIDKQGRMAGRAIGKVSESTLRGFVEPLLNEPHSEPVANPMTTAVPG